MERPPLAGASPRGQGSPTSARMLSRMPGRNRRGLTTRSRTFYPAREPKARARQKVHQNSLRTPFEGPRLPRLRRGESATFRVLRTARSPNARQTYLSEHSLRSGFARRLPKRKVCRGGSKIRRRFEIHPRDHSVAECWRLFIYYRRTSPGHDLRDDAGSGEAGVRCPGPRFDAPAVR